MQVARTAGTGAGTDVLSRIVSVNGDNVVMLQAQPPQVCVDGHSHSSFSSYINPCFVQFIWPFLVAGFEQLLIVALHVRFFPVRLILGRGFLKLLSMDQTSRARIFRVNSRTLGNVPGLQTVEGH